MKKKLIPLLMAGVLGVSLLIPGVQTFALETLSQFRVGQAKTIEISLDDIAQMADTMQQYKETEVHEDLDEIMADEAHALRTADEAEEQKPKQLNDISEFTAFPVKLPRELKDEQVELYATDVKEATITLENGTEASIALSPTLVANYGDVTFAATQGISDTLTDAQKAELQQALIAQPFLTEHIRSQLAEIDPSTKDIYLPVVTGISREAVINGTTGYLYGMHELQGISTALPESFAEVLKNTDETQQEMNLLIWTKDGVLYLLGGNKTAEELTEIARSVR